MTKIAAAARPSFDDFKARHDAFVARATSNRVAGGALEAAFVLRDAAEFLEWAAETVADGRALEDAEVCRQIQWALWKLAELPLTLDGEKLADAVPTDPIVSAGRKAH
jgi:hypothetical protein